MGLPDLTKPFTLYVTEKDKTAMGVLTQTLGTWDRPIAYLSKRLDNVATGWPSCLWAVAVVALLVREATKLTFSQDLIIKVHMKSTPSFEETPTSGYQIPRLFNTRDCYVKTPTSVLSLAGV